MQLVQDVSQELLSEYFGGEIIIANSAVGTTSFVRGTLLDARVIDGDWLSVKLTCDEFATGVLGSDAITWHASSGGETYALIYATPYQDDDGALHFTNVTPQGTTARISRAVTTSTEQAA